MAIKRTKTQKALFHAQQKLSTELFNRPSDQLTTAELNQRLLITKGKIDYETTLIQKFNADPKMAYLIEGCESRIQQHQKTIEELELLIKA